MSGKLDGAWAQIDSFDSGSHDCEEAILKLVLEPDEEASEKIRQLWNIACLNRMFSDSIFRESVEWDAAVIIDMAERGLLDRDGR